MRNLLFLLLLLTPLVLGCSDSQSNPNDGDAIAKVGQDTSETETSRSGTDGNVDVPTPGDREVVVVVDAPSGRILQVVRDVVQGTTLETVMRKVDQLDVMMTGSGETAFVYEIGGVATGVREGWTYEVDGEFANIGVGQFELEPPTTVRWSFGEMRQE